ncbi:MAG: dTDP-4-dehydrorhamnose reductase [Treponema sp.]|jgi:dTDP-4-dehydrorhamnose reductase|nr:dTDP-4-dehydrorhamnose reductase [Treponema sp.]
MKGGARVVWVIGEKGMLGTEVSLALEKAEIEHIGSDLDVDITNGAALNAFAEGKAIKWMVNCAAYTAVDRAEDESELCRRLNVDGAAEVAKLAGRVGARLIHVSTDYVFDGNGRRPYTEDDETNPTGVYGRTKRDGELEVLKNCKNSYILRSSWLYGKYGNNFVHTMIKLMQKQDIISVVNDQQGSPTWAHDFAQLIIMLIKKEHKSDGTLYGIYHFCNGGGVSRYDFAKEIYKQSRELGILTKECTITPCATEGYPAKARRPAYSCLDHTKIKTALNIKVSDWNVSLRTFLSIGNYNNI